MSAPIWFAAAAAAAATVHTSDLGMHPLVPPPPAAMTRTEYDDEYVIRNPSITELDTACDMSEHEVNTERTVHKNQGMKHFQGGWPENVDGTDTDQVNRYLKKFNKV